MLPDKMKILAASILVITYFSYSFFIYSALPVTKVSASDLSMQGKMLWQKYNCNACHQIYGLGGYLGPDLTNVYSLKGEPQIRAFLTYGTPVMPNFHLKEQEMNALVEYLKNTDNSGSSDPRKFKIQGNGTIN